MANDQHNFIISLYMKIGYSQLENQKRLAANAVVHYIQRWKGATGWTARVRFPEMQDCSLLHSVQTRSGAHPASYPMGSFLSNGDRGLFLGVQQPGREVDHSPPSSAEVKNGGAIPPLAHTSSWCGA
jgi:hypothetical protein